MATITKGKTFTNGELVTPATIHQLVDAATISGIVNVDISASAAISDTKLAQISTVGKVLPAAVQGTAVITTDSRLSDARTPVTHTHDDRYYTEAEMTTLLAGKQASGSYAPATGIAPSAITGTAVITTDSRLSDARTPVTHTHTIANVTNLQTTLDGKQASGSYAPATGIAPSAITGTAVITTDSRLSDARTPTTHTHDDRYYTEAEIDTKLSGLPVAGHTHTIANVTGLQTALDGKQASGSYAPATGIAPSAITGTAVITTDSRLSDARTPVTHTHDDRYYTETEMTTLLAGKQASGSYAPATGIAPSAITGTAVITTDSRLSDARTPVTHTHTIANVTNLQTTLDTKVSGSNLGLCSAWVNFNHSRMLGVTNAANGETISVTAGSSSGTWNSTVAFSTGQIGIIYYITSAGSVPNASLGGINVSTLGFQIRAISGNTATIKLLAGPATASQTITGNGGTSGFQYISYGIRAQYGVASITKAASGSHMNFTFNFSTPFDFIDYCYQFQMDARSSADIYIQTKGQSSIQLQVLNFSDASVSSQMNFMAFGL